MSAPSVVNVKSVNMGDRDIVYIGRANPSHGLPASVFANPFKIGRHGDRAACVQKYRELMDHRLLHARIIWTHRLRQLADKRLACWCKQPGELDVPCHGDVLAELVAKLIAGAL